MVEPRRPELHAHCYRMLGSVHDAEDALQDALLRAWRGLRAFEGRSSFRSWLYTIATNTCLDQIARRPKRVLPVDYGLEGIRTTGQGETHRRVGLGGAVSGRGAGIAGGPPAGRPARAAGGRRAGVHRRPPAPARPPASRADHARGARVLGQGGGQVADTTSVGEQRPQRACVAADERLPAQSQQATLRLSATPG